MKRPKIAILGASGIGKFHAREFRNAGAEVCAILGSSGESSRKTSEMLKKEYNIESKYYHDIDNLLRDEKLEAVSICTPPHLHFAQVKKCLENGLHVICEKPLINEIGRAEEDAKNLLNLAGSKNKILTVNTQWPSIFNYIPKINEPLKNFSFYSEPGTRGKELILDHLPHANSILVKLIPQGKAKEISFLKLKEDEAEIKFIYHNKTTTCNALYHFKFKAERPRDIIFSFNDLTYKREVDELYNQFLVSNKERFAIEDPLRVSITKFVESFQNKNPLISENEILENAKIQDEILLAIINNKV